MKKVYQSSINVFLDSNNNNSGSTGNGGNPNNLSSGNTGTRQSNTSNTSAGGTSSGTSLGFGMSWYSNVATDPHTAPAASMDIDEQTDDISDNLDGLSFCTDKKGEDREKLYTQDDFDKF